MSKIPYRAFPISLETDETWMLLSLKRRALFTFLVSKAVSDEIYIYQGKTLTFGQYVWSYNKLLEKFNETLISEDQYSKTGLYKAIQFLVEKKFIRIEKWGTGEHSETLITILKSDCYELLKNTQRTAFCDERTTREHPNIFFREHPENNEKDPQDIFRDVNLKPSKSSREQVKIPLNNEERTSNIDLTESTLTSLLEDNVRTVPSSKEDLTQDFVKAPPKYKLNPEQSASYSWLQAQKIDTSDGTLSWWAKTYDLKRLKDVHKAAVKVKPKKNKKNSVGALMNNFLKKEIPVETDFRKQNEEFVYGFIDREPGMNWKIEKKFVTCQIKGILKEVFFDIHPQSFVDQLIILENQFKGN